MWKGSFVEYVILIAMLSLLSFFVKAFRAFADSSHMAATKGIRLNAVLRKQFERFCRDQLLDERAVIEAWLLRFLEASEAERKEAATRYVAWYEEFAGERSAVHPETIMRKGPGPSRSRRQRDS